MMMRLLGGALCKVEQVLWWSGRKAAFEGIAADVASSHTCAVRFASAALQLPIRCSSRVRLCVQRRYLHLSSAAVLPTAPKVTPTEPPQPSVHAAAVSLQEKHTGAAD